MTSLDTDFIIDLLRTDFQEHYEKIVAEYNSEKEATRDSIKFEIKDWLWKDVTGLPESYTTEEISQKAEVVYAHIFRVYNTASPEVYEVA